MPFELKWSPDARDHLLAFPANRRSEVVDGAVRHLVGRPDIGTRRLKPLRENPLATWQLRLGDVRVFYNIDRENEVVEIVAVGRKVHDRLIIADEEVEL